jgi:hypothetical protein
MMCCVECHTVLLEKDTGSVKIGQVLQNSVRMYITYRCIYRYALRRNEGPIILAALTKLSAQQNYYSKISYVHCDETKLCH